MAKQIYLNLPIKDLEKTVTFFTELGFTFEPRFSNEQAACLAVESNIFIMLLTEAFFNTFTERQICDTRSHLEAITAISVENREAVDGMVEKAISMGAAEARPAMDHGFMYVRSFYDLDGHLWEIFSMDMQQAPPAE